MDNRLIAQRLLAHANRLDRIDPNVYRRRAYRRAAQTIMAETRPVEELLRARGRAGLRGLVGIGVSLARAIEGLIETGEIPVNQTEEETVRMTREPAGGPRGRG